MTDDHRVVASGAGELYDWANDTVRIKTPAELTGSSVTVVEDTLKPGFLLARHHHKTMTEIFYIIDGEVSFAFDDETVLATPGTTVNIRPGVHHEVTSADGARMITVFTPGGFDAYLSAVADLVAAGTDNEAALTALGHRYDIWPDA